MPRNRGQETSIQVVVDGQLQTGSFAKVTDFKLTPRLELMESDFLGEKESEVDVQHHGYDFSFSVHEADAKCAELLDKIVQNEIDGLPPPRVNITVRTRFRDPSLRPRVDVLQLCVIKPDDRTDGGRKEYTKWSFSGKCKKRVKLPVS